MYPRTLMQGNPPSATSTQLLWIDFPLHPPLAIVTPGTPVHLKHKPFLNHTSHLIPLYNSTTVV